MQIQILIDSGLMSAEELKEQLEDTLSGNNAEARLRTERLGIRIRGMDPTILVAVVGAAGVSLGALISGLFQVAQQKSLKKIVVQSRDGARLEFPADTKPEEIDMLIEKVRALEAWRIILR